MCCGVGTCGVVYCVVVCVRFGLGGGLCRWLWLWCWFVVVLVLVCFVFFCCVAARGEWSSVLLVGSVRWVEEAVVLCGDHGEDTE